MLKKIIPIVIFLLLISCSSSPSEKQMDMEIIRSSPKMQPIAAGNILDGKETKDTGNDPSTAGCLDVYTSTNNTCVNRVQQWGDWCDSNGTHINERVDPPNCSNQQYNVQNIDCRTHLNDQRARCVKVPNHCPVGNILNDPDSAHCIIPPIP